MIDRDEEIVRIVASAVRVMSIPQVAREWWSDTRWGKSRAKRTLEELAVEDLLHIRRVLARPIEPLAKPLLQWELEDPQPDFEGLAHALHQRAKHSAKMMTIFFATSRSVALFSSGRRPTIKLTQMTHDLQVTEVFLHYRRNGWMNAWLSEDHLPADWPIQARPDALLCDDHGDILRAVEYGGDYPAERLAELHDGLSWAGLSYEIW